MDDVEVLKIALYYFIDRILNKRKDECVTNKSLLNKVDNLEYFRSLP